MTNDYVSDAELRQHLRKLGLNPDEEQTFLDVQQRWHRLNQRFHPDSRHRDERTGETEEETKAKEERLKLLEPRFAALKENQDRIPSLADVEDSSSEEDDEEEDWEDDPEPSFWDDYVPETEPEPPKPPPEPPKPPPPSARPQPIRPDRPTGRASIEPRYRLYAVLGLVALLIIIVIASTGHSSPSTAPQGGTSTTSRSWCPSSGDNDGSLLNSTTSASSLENTLTQIEKQATSDVAGPAKALLTEISNLTPAPQTSLEALGRLRFASGASPTSQLSAIDNGSNQACNEALFGPSAIQTVDSITPAPQNGGVAFGFNPYNACPQLDRVLGFVAPFLQVSQCGQEIIVVNGSNGAISISPSFLPENADLVLGNSSSGPDVAWTTTNVTQANPLAQPYWSATLNIYSAAGSMLAQSFIISNQPGASANSPSLQATPVGTFVTEVTAASGNDELAVWNSSGSVLAAANSDSVEIANEPISPSFSTFNFGEQVANTLTGAIVFDSGNKNNSNYFTSDGGCGLNSLLQYSDSSRNSSAVIIDDGANGPSLVQAPALNSDMYGNPVGISSLGLIAHDSGGGIELVKPNGLVAWDLHSNVVAGAKDILGWPFVTNRLGDTVVVDPSSGQPETSLPSSVTALLNALNNDEAKVVLSDPRTNSLVVETGTVGSTIDTDYMLKSVCQ